MPVRFTRERGGWLGEEAPSLVGGLARVQDLEVYRRKARFKQVKFGVVVLGWQGLLFVLAMLLLKNDPGQSSPELLVMAKITTFLVVFVAIFCGWPCLLHFMAGFARTGVVLSSVTGCLVFQSALLLRATLNLAYTGERRSVDLHDMTEAVLVTASIHVASLSLLGRMPPLHLLLAAALALPGQVCPPPPPPLPSPLSPDRGPQSPV